MPKLHDVSNELIGARWPIAFARLTLLRFSLGYLPAAILPLTYHNGGVVLFVALIPVITPLGGFDLENLPEGIKLPWLRAIVLGWPPVQLALTLWGLHTIVQPTTTVFDKAVITISLGFVASATGISYAHELMHGGTGLERAMARLLMTLVTYPHFCIEHVFVHHRYVATRLDPASAHFGESLYAFQVRSVRTGIVSAWRIELQRLLRLGQPIFSWHNKMLQNVALVFAVYSLVIYRFGVIGGTALAVHSVVAIFLLEAINYVQHYGLERRETAPGRFEPIRPWHSWNGSFFLGNSYLLNMLRHSDHHVTTVRPFYALRRVENAPQLPAGYFTMALCATIPPLWREIMDPLTLMWRRQMTLGDAVAFRSRHSGKIVT